MASLVAGALVYAGVAAGTAATIGTGVAAVATVASVAAAGVSIANALDTPDGPDGPQNLPAPVKTEEAAKSTSSLGVSSITPSGAQIGEAQRRQQVAIRNKSGRRSTILSGGSSAGPTPGSATKRTLG